MLINKRPNSHRSLRFRNICTTSVIWIIGLLLFSGCATTAKTTKPIKTTQQCPLDKPAVAQMQQQAEAGDPNAQYQVAIWYWIGPCLDRDYAEANKWFLKAAEQGHVDAQVKTANNYRFADKDIDNAIHWYQLAADAGSPLAARKLGSIYFAGKDVEKNLAKAEKWYSRALELGDSTSKHMLSKVKIERDPKWQSAQRHLAEEKATKALRLFEERAANFLLLKEKAERGDREAQYKLGKLYSTGNEYIKKDLSLATELIKKSADQGYLAAEIYIISKENKTTDELDGIWTGEFDSNSPWFFGSVKLQINEKENEVYTGHVLEFAHHSLFCKGANVKLRRQSKKNLSITIWGGGGCNVEGNLQYSRNALTGNIVIQNSQYHKVTLDLVRLSTDPNQIEISSTLMKGFPDNWPAATSSDDIEDRIPGKYSCHGIRNGRISIIENAGGLKGEKFPTCEFFEFDRVNDGELRLRLSNKDGEKVYERILVKGKNYSFKDGWIQLKTDLEFGLGATSGIVVVGGSSETSYIGLTATNHLITKTTKGMAAIGVAYIVPIPFSSEEPPIWGLFERVQK